MDGWRSGRGEREEEEEEKEEVVVEGGGGGGGGGGGQQRSHVIRDQRAQNMPDLSHEKSHERKACKADIHPDTQTQTQTRTRAHTHKIQAKSI